MAVAVAGCDKNAQWKNPLDGVFGAKQDIKTETTLLEIDAVGRLNGDTAKYEGFLEIARRENLSPTEQVYLARTAVKTLYLDEDKREILEQLIDSELYSCACKKEILAQLGQFKKEESRVAVLQKINSTETCLDQWPVDDTKP